MALLLVLATTLTAFAKGGFNFISIAGPGLKEEVRVTDLDLTEDFFAFANFYKDRIEAPANPGEGYEITRGYVDGKREIIFDRLHYYPDTGFVYYDGIENGESEYDGEWYAANPDIKTVFEAALAGQTGSASPVEKKQPQPSVSQPQTQPLRDPASLPSFPLIMVIVVTGLTGLFAFAFWRRKVFPQ
jgi:hypothetical protein